MKKHRSMVGLALAFSLMLCAVTNASAVETRASAYLTAYLAYVYPDGNGSVSVWFEVEATGKMDEVGALDIILQERLPGSTKWTTVATYWHAFNPGMLLTEANASFHYGHVDYEGVAGRSYQALVTVWAGKDGDGDSRDILTDVITAT